MKDGIQNQDGLYVIMLLWLTSALVFLCELTQVFFPFNGHFLVVYFDHILCMLKLRKSIFFIFNK